MDLQDRNIERIAKDKDKINDKNIYKKAKIIALQIQTNTVKE